MDKKKPDWDIHYVANGCTCDESGKVESSFPQYVCDAHTHGMDQYGQMEFQVVVDYGAKEICRLLNTMGSKVREGQRFKSGDLISGLYLDCDILLREAIDCNGKQILRLIIPDRQNRWPEESEPPHNYQMLATPLLYLK